jgi:D-alanyl-D-alanine dipeptidase
MTTLISDARVAGIAVHDNGEPLVDLTTYGIDCLPSGSGSVARLVRRGVAERLAAAAASLPTGISLLVVEGFRTPQAQQDIVSWYRRRLVSTHPGLGDDELLRLVSRFVAPLHVAPHVAGAAVDLTLTSAGGGQLEMGTDVDATPEDSDNACSFDSPAISAEARENRALLAGALGPAGLVNYPTEWWHWSYGDRYWAHVGGVATACYGPVSDPVAASGVVPLLSHVAQSG